MSREARRDQNTCERLFFYFISIFDTISHAHVLADYLLSFLQYIVRFGLRTFATPVMGMGGGIFVLSITQYMILIRLLMIY